MAYQPQWFLFSVSTSETASWSRSSSVLANRYGRHVLILCSLDSTKSAFPVEQKVFQHFATCSGHFKVFSTFYYLFKALLFLLRKTASFNWWKWWFTVILCQMFRSYWPVSWTKLVFVFIDALAFNMDYVQWQDDHKFTKKQRNELKAALNAYATDDDLRCIIYSIIIQLEWKIFTSR